MSLFDMVRSLKELEGLSWNTIAQRIKGVREFESGEALRSWFRRERSKRLDHQPVSQDALHTDHIAPPPFPKPFENIFEIALESSERALILADIHVPYHSIAFIERALNTALESSGNKLAAIIIAGDLFTFDQISKYSKAHNMPRMETELEIGGSMLLYLAKHAPVYITNSNHDSRFANRMDTQFSLKRLMNAALNGRKPANQIFTTERDYLFLNNDFIIGHLTNASGIAGKIAHNIAQKYQRHCLAGHDHITGVFNSRSRYIGASIGCSADHDKFWYAEKGMNPTKFMQRGYAIVGGNSEIQLFNENHKRYFHRWQESDFYHTHITDTI